MSGQAYIGLYWGYIGGLQYLGIIEKKIEATILYGCQGYMGYMFWGLGCWVCM